MGAEGSKTFEIDDASDWLSGFEGDLSMLRTKAR